MQKYRWHKLKGSVSRMPLQIDMQNFVSTKSDLLAIKKMKKKIIFAKIWDVSYHHWDDKPINVNTTML